MATVLTEGRVVRTDYFPGMHRLDEPPIKEGVYNFRHIPELGVAGVSQPWLESIPFIQQKVGPEVVWVHLREEPVVYLAGKPYNLRYLFNPFKNLTDYSGTTRERAEKLEQQLHDEIIEYTCNHGYFPIFDERKDGDDIDVFEHKLLLEEAEVHSPFSAFSQFGIPWYRVPITDERSADLIDIENLDTLFQQYLRAEIAMIFNCHVGRGRTTTAMVLAGLFLTIDQAKSCSIGCGDLLDFSLSHALPEDIKKDFQPLVKAHHSKKFLDVTIDRLDHVQNLREVLSEVPERSMKRFYFLERYLHLVEYSRYLLERKCGLTEQGFVDWVKESSELKSLLKKVKSLF